MALLYAQNKQQKRRLRAFYLNLKASVAYATGLSVSLR
ncbi:hypothetical protein PPRY_a0564 [Pseudoalteromonas prydzensis ACAM 620]|nr:hypothetical protein [Pseudoalteromonas prydzensis ACAM 620]